ncbi:ribosomal protein L6, alpha-beta domain-containing protein [Mycena floridula]|nr:ribosomal protein L6, alpha-beta domain-containing protein [Mycena floridula]
MHLPRAAALGVRAFSSTAAARKHIAHIGGRPIVLPPNVTLSPSSTELSIQGPLGTTSIFLHPFVKLDMESNILNVSVEDSEIKHQRAMWGTTRTLIQNAIVGMTEGFTVPLYLVGVGYRVALEEDPRGTMDGGNGQRLTMKVGFSHAVHVPIPPEIKAEVPSATKIVLFCLDKQRLGLFAAKVKSYRRPEPYKGKGIFIGNETIRIKAVKKK